VRGLLLSLLVTVGAAGAACSDVRQGEVAGQAASLLDSADQVAFTSRTLITDAGLLRAEIFADTTFFLDQNTRISMRVVHGEFFNEQKAKDATLTSQRANYNTRLGTLEAWGNVVVTSVDGRVLKSPMLKYDQRDNQILSDSSFVLTEADGKETRGVGFRADPNLDVITVLQMDRTRGGTVRLTPQ